LIGIGDDIEVLEIIYIEIGKVPLDRPDILKGGICLGISGYEDAQEQENKYNFAAEAGRCR
jgi:hypothetical protein